MRPVLFEIGGFQVPAYGAALALAFTVGIVVAASRALRFGLDPLAVLDVSLVIVVASLAGSRLLFVATNLELFQPPLGRWTDAFDPTGGSRLGLEGLAMLGGVALALLSSYAFLRARGLPALRYCDLVAPSVALGEAITRIGCFLNGCCFGTACTLPWAVTFPEGSVAAGIVGHDPLHPAQIYTSVYSLALFILLLRLARRTPAPGTVVSAMTAGVGGGRVLLELVRHHETADVAFRLSSLDVTVHQVLATALLIVGLLGVVAFRSRTPVHGSDSRKEAMRTNEENRDA